MCHLFPSTLLIHLFLNDHASDVGADNEDHAGDGVTDGEQGGRVVGRQVGETELKISYAAYLLVYQMFKSGWKVFTYIHPAVNEGVGGHADANGRDGHGRVAPDEAQPEEGGRGEGDT